MIQLFSCCLAIIQLCNQGKGCTFTVSPAAILPESCAKTIKQLAWLSCLIRCDCCLLKLSTWNSPASFCDKIPLWKSIRPADFLISFLSVAVRLNCMGRSCGAAPAICHKAGMTNCKLPTTVDSGLPGKPKYNTGLARVLVSSPNTDGLPGFIATL